MCKIDIDRIALSGLLPFRERINHPLAWKGSMSREESEKLLAAHSESSLASGTRCVVNGDGDEVVVTILVVSTAWAGILADSLGNGMLRHWGQMLSAYHGPEFQENVIRARQKFVGKKIIATGGGDATVTGACSRIEVNTDSDAVTIRLGNGLHIPFSFASGGATYMRSAPDGKGAPRTVTLC